VVGATRLVTGASGATPNGDVYFPDEFFVTASAFALGQVHNFGSLVYIADYYGDLRLLHRAPPAGGEPSALPPLPGPSRPRS
jgi:hypothetical protein